MDRTVIEVPLSLSEQQWYSRLDRLLHYRVTATDRKSSKMWCAHICWDPHDTRRIERRMLQGRARTELGIYLMRELLRPL